MNDITIFENEKFGNVRIAIGENNEPLFCAIDVATALGYKEPRQAVAMHCKSAELVYCPHANGIGGTNIKFIKESDVYRLIMKSELETAIDFQDWVCEDVLPSIRKNGIYATDNVIDQILNNPDFGIELLTKLKEERTARIEAESTVAILTHTNKTYTVTEVAKELGMKSANELNNKLHEKGIQYKVNNTWVPYTDYASLAWFEIKQETLDNGKVIYHRKITGIGRKAIIDLFK